jgi:peptidoglycan-N-acetylglucosamine deacetylase
MSSIFFQIFLVVMPMVFGLFFGSPSVDVERKEVLGVATHKKVLYLTFDADMTPSMQARLSNGSVGSWYDPAIIEYLKQKKIPATFFVSGLFAETYPDSIAELGKIQDYAIGNHGFDHAAWTAHCYNLPAILTDAEKLEQISRTQKIIENLTGKAPKFFRFPGLCRSPHDSSLVASQGLQIADADVIASDAFNKNPGQIVEKILGGAQDGSIILMHLGGPNAPGTYPALQTVIPKLEAEGFIFEKLN